MKKFLLAISVLLIFTSCCKYKGETYFLRSYIMHYRGVDKIQLKESNLTRGYISILYIGYPLCNYKSTGNAQQLYDDLCQKHNDMTFNREVTDTQSKKHWVGCIATDFISVDIVSDSGFDANHPAGTSLGDIVSFFSMSLKPFIDSGYILECQHDDCRREVRSLLSELTPDQLTLLGGFTNSAIGDLIFDSQPTLSQTHKFTVTMTADDGRVFTASVDMTFE